MPLTFEKYVLIVLKLFQGYKAAADSKFVDCIETKEESYLDGKLLDATKLMQQALNKYTTRKTSGKYETPTEEQEQLIALTTKASKLQAENKDILSRHKASQKRESISRSAKAKLRAKEER